MKPPRTDTYKGPLCPPGTGGCQWWTGKNGQQSQYRLEALHLRFCARVLEKSIHQERNSDILHGDPHNSCIHNVWMPVQNGF